MYYRIVEFTNKINDKSYFVETGQKVREKWFSIFSKTKTVWSPDMNEKGEAIEYKEFSEALKRVNQLKEMQPVYHVIK